MSQITEINQQILQVISKTNSFYETLWGRVDFTPALTITEPNDYRCGAIANQLEYLYAWIEEITGLTLAEIPEPNIDIIVYFFSGIRRYPGEDVDRLLLRMNSLLIREADWRSVRMGTPWDIKNVFSYYVSRNQLYYVPNCVLTNDILNGGFEDAIGAEWTILPTDGRAAGDQFVGAYCMDFSVCTSAAQTISVTSGAYIIHFFAQPVSAPVGDTDILTLTLQRDSDSYYYNIETESWQAADPVNTYTTDGEDYALVEYYMITDGSYNVTATWTKLVDFYLDRVEIGEKEYPCFELLYRGLERAGAGFASMWVDGVTPYDYAAFLDQDFMFESGANIYSDSYYQDLLDMVKAAGVRGVWSREERI